MSDSQAQLDLLNLLLQERSLQCLGDVIDKRLGNSEEHLQNLAADVTVLQQRLADAQTNVQSTGSSKEELEQQLEQANEDLVKVKAEVKTSSVMRNEAQDDLDDLKTKLAKKEKKAKQSEEAASILASKISKIKKDIEEQEEELETQKQALSDAKTAKKKAKNEVARIQGLIDAWVPPQKADTAELERELTEAKQKFVSAKANYRSRAFAQTRIDLLLSNLATMEAQVFPETVTDDTDVDAFIKNVWDSNKDTPDESVYAHVITANAKKSRKRRSTSPSPDEDERESQRAKSLDIGAPVEEPVRPSTGGKRLMPKGGAMSQVLLLKAFKRP